MNVFRFAPSPTGYLHVGGARTAIFNWLYARRTGGRFLLRIEDTDRERSSEEMTREILDGLRWLGLDWDEEPLLQSSRIERHRAEAIRLLREGKAYPCFCSQAELDTRRAASGTAEGDTKYDRTCLRLDDAERRSRIEAGVPYTIRFRVPEGVTEFYDIVHEETSFDNRELEDFVILRSDGTPVYMIAVVVDDHDMGVTHVIRGDDHLPNTPKQILLYHALGYEVPMFGHVPLILGPDKKRLSKRHGATSVGEYQARGYLPSALFNYLALLGWSPGDDRELFTREELVVVFDARRLLKKSSVFDEEKLRWMNGKHIRMLSDDELLAALRPFIPPRHAEVPTDYLRAMIPLLRERMELLPDFFERGRIFLEDPESYDEKAVSKYWNDETAAAVRMIAADLADASFHAADLEKRIRAFAESSGIGAGKLIHALRLALTGGLSSPGIFETMAVLGKETCLRRIRKALESIEASA
ncbi:MAG: glutamate--tRNA ligase [Bacteroidota bacterium]|nr:glutamate--tRNA ligase [Bacteroidota bacterium]